MLTKNDELEYWWNVKDTWDDADMYENIDTCHDELKENQTSIHKDWNWLGPIYL